MAHASTTDLRSSQLQLSKVNCYNAGHRTYEVVLGDDLLQGKGICNKHSAATMRQDLGQGRLAAEWHAHPGCT